MALACGMILHAELLDLLHYDAATGVFSWKVRRNAYRGAVNPGDPAGMIDRSTGYTKIGINGRPYLAHRLAWFYVHGEWPPHETDHIDGDRSNNRLANLRLATRQQNARNSPLRADNTSGHRGVYWGAKQGRWYARIWVDGVPQSLGGHATKEAAAAAYDVAAKLHHGEFMRT